MYDIVRVSHQQLGFRNSSAYMHYVCTFYNYSNGPSCLYDRVFTTSSAGFVMNALANYKTYAHVYVVRIMIIYMLYIIIPRSTSRACSNRKTKS